MNTQDITDLQRRCKNMTTADLLSATRLSREEYTAEALSIMDREVQSRGVTRDQVQEHAESVARQEQENEDRLSGIKGWLTVFITMVGLSATVGLMTGISSLRMSRQFLEGAFLSPQLLLSAYGFYGLVLLLKRKPQAPFHAERWIFSSLLYTILLLFFGHKVISNDNDVFAITAVFPLGMAFWLHYLIKSKRVAATFNQDVRPIGKVMKKQIVLISCARKKLSHRAKAKDLYISPLFKLSLKYANKLSPDGIYILSAEHYLLDLDEEIEPYKKTLNNMRENEVRQWADGVIEQIKKVSVIGETNFVFLAGEKYRKHLIPQLRHNGAGIEIPLEGLRIGEQVQRLTELTA